MHLIKFDRPTRNNSPFSNLIEEFFNNGFNAPAALRKTPSTNLKETENAFEIELAVPGLNKADFNIQVENDQLIISTEKSTEKEEGEKGGKYFRREFNYSAFKKVFHLTEDIDADNIDAAYTNGVLHLTLAKKEAAKEKAPKMIEIK